MKTGQVNGIKALVIGGSGFVGRHLMNYFSCPGTSRSGDLGFMKLDIMDINGIRKVLRETSPDLVINASGLTNVDYCESHPDEAMTTNGTAVGIIADAVEESGATLCHISTDYVYSGETGKYSEDDITEPVNAYGRSKLKGEEMLKGRRCIIIRISTPYGMNLSGKKTTFMEFVLSNLREGKGVRIVTDQFTSPTYLGEIPAAIEALFSRNRLGVYNLGSSECMSRYDFSMLLADVFSLEKKLIIQARTADLGFAARRPLNCCMDTSKIREIMSIKSIRHNLMEIKHNISR